MVITKDLIEEELDYAEMIAEECVPDFVRPNFVQIRLSNARSFWGTVRHLGCGTYRLTVSNIFNDIKDNSNASMKLTSTLVHEILHTQPGCMNHGRKWKALAEKVNRKYPYLNIQRCTSSVSYGVERRKPVYKYKVTCGLCNAMWFRQKATDTTNENFLNRFCSCGRCGGKGHFTVVSL